MKVQYDGPNQAKNNGRVSFYDISNMDVYQLDLQTEKHRLNKGGEPPAEPVPPVNLPV